MWEPGSNLRLEDPLEDAVYSKYSAQENPTMDREPQQGYRSLGHKESDITENKHNTSHTQLSLVFAIVCNCLVLSHRPRDRMISLQTWDEAVDSLRGMGLGRNLPGPASESALDRGGKAREDSAAILQHWGLAPGKQSWNSLN